jgi:hypothetical protein
MRQQQKEGHKLCFGGVPLLQRQAQLQLKQRQSGLLQAITAETATIRPVTGNYS